MKKKMPNTKKELLKLIMKTLKIVFFQKSSKIQKIWSSITNITLQNLKTIQINNNNPLINITNTTI